MANIKKIIQKMKNQPNGITYNEAVCVLNGYGYNFARQNGSHCHYRNNEGDVITILHKSPLKKAYVIEILERIGEK